MFFHRRFRSNITHLAHHLENLPIPLISFAKKHSSPKGDSDLLLCGRWRRPKKQQVRIFSDPLDFSVFLQNTSTSRPCERSESARKSSEGTFSRGAPKKSDQVWVSDLGKWKMIPRAWEVYPEEMGDFLLFVKTGGFFQRGDHRMIFLGRKRFFISFFHDYKIKGRSSEHCPALFFFKNVF